MLTHLFKNQNPGNNVNDVQQSKKLFVGRSSESESLQSLSESLK